MGTDPLDQGRPLPVIDAVTSEAWVDALRDFLAGCADPLAAQDWLTAGRRQAWKVFLDLKPGSRLLCIGAGSGLLAESLAPHARQLFVLDHDLQRLRFVRQRLAIRGGAERVVLLAGDEDTQLPFAEGVFDGVVLAEHAVSGPPAPLLGEVRRVLKSDGQVFVLGDNRFSLSLPPGWWDRWSGLPFPLPGLARGLGLFGGWWRKRSGSQSLPSLSGKLRQAGFSNLDALGLHPGRSRLDEIIPLDRRWQNPLADRELSRKQRLKRRGVFLPAYGIIAQAGGERRQSSFERLLDRAARQLAGDRGAGPLRPARNVITRKDKLIIHAQQHDVFLVLRLPFGAAAEAAEARNAAVTARLAEQSRGVSPRPLAAGDVDGISYYLETALPGRPLKRVMARSSSTDLLGRVETMLETLNPAPTLRREKLEGALYERLVEERLERLFRFLPGQDRQQGLRAFFRHKLLGAEMALGLVHGDFSGSNIYLAEQKAGIIDWESGAFDDLPILDAIGYLESILRPAAKGHSLALSFRALAQWDLPSAAEKQFLAARYARLGVDATCHPGLVYLRWLRQIDHLLPYWLRYDPAGQDRYIHQVVQSLLAPEPG